MHQYIELLEKIRTEGKIKGDRTGTGTFSIFGHQMRFRMSDGFPLLSIKKTHFKSVVHELLWFLQGSTNTKYLKDNGVTIWNEWEDEDGELGPVYGKQWVDWLGYGDGVQSGHMDALGHIDFRPKGINQIEEVINQLKNNPDSRRIMVNAWNVSEINKMKLPPCHYGFQFYTTELSQSERLQLFPKYHPNKSIDDFRPEGMEVQSLTHQWESRLNKAGIPKRAVSLMWHQRSVDTFLGLPFNIASYGLLLHMIAQCVNMVPYELIGTLGDTHLYSNHSEQVRELLSRWKEVKSNEPKLPILKLNPEIKDIFSFKYEDITLEGYNPMPSIKAPVAI
jgi:thymidylate synthase